MPFIVNKKNVEKILTPFLRESEGLCSILITKGMNRLSLVLTDQKRLIIASLPLIGQSQMKKEYYIDEIESIDYFPGPNSMRFIIKTIEDTVVYNLPLSHPRFPVKEELIKFAKEIRKINPRARPEYITENENIIEMIKVKQGIFKLTECTIFLFKPSAEKEAKWEINEKIPINTIEELDYYPETPDLLCLYIENERGESRLYKIESTAMFLNIHSGSGNPDLLIENIYEVLAPFRKKLTPTYLYDDEEVITTLRALSNVSGSVSLEIILRLTNKRLLDLSREKLGRLDLKTEIILEDIEKTTITKHTGNRDGEKSGTYYILSIHLAKDKKYEYWIDTEYQYAVDKITAYFAD